MEGKYVATRNMKSFILTKLLAPMLDDSSTRNTMSAWLRPQPGTATADSLKVKCAIFRHFEEEKAASRGYILDCSDFYSLYPY